MVSVFQSTHPRGVRRPKLHDGNCHREVSIHAPAWGATASFSEIGRRVVGFNPRTRVGCDVVLFDTTIPHASFNPRTRVGCDQFWGHILHICNNVSIHAPAWGATGSVPSAVCNTSEFQSTHPRGVRPSVLVGPPVIKSSFQSTHPRGVRRHAYQSFSALFCFNPRTRVGCDGGQART